MRQFNCSVTGAIVSLSFLGIVTQISPASAQTSAPISLDQVKPLEVPQGTSRDLNGLSQPNSPFNTNLDSSDIKPIESQEYQIQPTSPDIQPANTLPLPLPFQLPLKPEWTNQGEPPTAGGTVPLVNF